MKYKFITAQFVLLLLVVAVAAGCGGAPAPTPKPTPSATVSVSAVTAKGSVVPNHFARIAFNVGGTVAKVNVQEGAQVKAGDVIAQLDTKDLEFQVRAAQDALDLAQASLTQAKTPPSDGEIAIAQAAYDGALTQLTRAQRGPTPDDLDILRANLAKSKAMLDQAQAVYDRAGGASNPFIALTPAALQLQAATLDYTSAQANFNKTIKPDPLTIQQAQSGVDQAKAQLDLRKRGPRAEDIAVAQVRVQQAQTALDQANAALAKAKLVAPFDATLTNLNLRVGESVQPGAPVATLADLTSLRVETTDLDEFGAAKVQVGQAVNITINAFTDKTLTGQVTNIAQQSVTLSTGDISYVVQIALDKQDPELRWGMTVKVQFAN